MINKNWSFFLFATIVLGMMNIFTMGGCGGSGSDSPDLIEEGPCDYNLNVNCESQEVGDLICEKYCYKNSGEPDSFVLFNNNLIFFATIGCKNSRSRDLIGIDDSLEFTKIMGYGNGGYIDEYQIVGNVLYYSNGSSILEYDGISAPKKIEDLDSVFHVDHLMAYENSIIFNVYPDDVSQPSIYSYDEDDNLKYIGDVKCYSDYIVYNDKLYFGGYTDEYGSELWCYDGISTLSIPSTGSGPSHFIIYSDKLFFSAYDNENGTELWMLNGDENPVMLTNTEYIRPVAVYQEKLLCAVEDPESGKKVLYEYDGTYLDAVAKDETYNIQYPEYYPYDQINIEITWYIIFNSNLYFLAEDSTGTILLWAYNGIDAPEKINTADSVENIYLYGENLLLDNWNGERIYSYDGVNDPVVLFEADNSELSYYCLRAVYQNYCFITGDSDTYGDELWVLDSTGEFILYEDFYPGTTCDCACGD